MDKQKGGQLGRKGPFIAAVSACGNGAGGLSVSSRASLGYRVSPVSKKQTEAGRRQTAEPIKYMAHKHEDMSSDQIPSAHVHAHARAHTHAHTEVGDLSTVV